MITDFNEWFNNVFEEEFKSEYYNLEFEPDILTPETEMEDYLIRTVSDCNVGEASSMRGYIKFELSAENARNLGLAILAVVFSDSVNEMTINLHNENNDIHKIIIRYNGKDEDELLKGYKSRPLYYKFEENPNIVNYYYSKDFYPRNQLPVIHLTNSKGYIDTEEDWFDRDIAKIEGSAKSMIALADFLLNISQDNVQHKEFYLDSDENLGGVGPDSTELCFIISGVVEGDDE